MLHTSIYVFWLAAFVLQCAITRQLLVRHLFRDYPLFFAYIVEHIFSFLSLFLAFHLSSRVFYRHLYMGWEAIDVVLKFGIIAELFAHIFARYKTTQKWGTVIVRGASVILVLSAAIVASSSNLADPNSFLSKFFAMEQSAEIVQGGLLFLLFALCYALALQWKQPSLGIAFGLAFITSIYLSVFTLRSELGSSNNQVFSLILSGGYDFGMLIWLFTLFPQHHNNHSVARSVPDWNVASWNRTLTELLRR